MLWGIVALRLICPISIESVISLIPSSETVSPDIITEQVPSIDTGIPFVNEAVNPMIGESLAPSPGDSANPLQIIIPILTFAWAVGVGAMLIYALISYLRLKRRIGTAVLLRDNVYQSEHVASPFVLGIIKPRIYIPFALFEDDASYVLAHEAAHIKRCDHLWKPIGFIVLSLHWFNPLVWLAYVLLCRDIELACDEKVIESLDRDQRADYSQALVNCSVNRGMISFCPLAFGEVGVGKRVKSVLSYKKPEFWIIIAAVVSCIIFAVCSLTDPPSAAENNKVTNDDTVFTEYDGVYVTVKSVDINAGGHTVFNLEWNNETNKTVTYGEFYAIERKVGEEWVDVSTKQMMFFTIGLILKPESVAYKSYSAQYFDISKKGTYRVSVPFHVDNGNGHEPYKTWIEFKVEEDSAQENSNNASLVCAAPMYSFVMDESLVPNVIIDKSNKLYLSSGKLVGTVSETELSETAFSDMLAGYGDEYVRLAEEIEGSTKTAYLVTPLEESTIDLYYILEQNDGAKLLVYGHYGEFSNEIRWIYRVV
jgi:beta-lactamase regulating signal transducer with metallopeptidase domain